MDLSNIKNEYKYKIELHAHTSPCSDCSHVSPEETVELYSAKGIDAIVITNHFLYYWKDRGEAGKSFADIYAEDFYRAEKRGKELGVKVIFGSELRFYENFNDYLIYGIDTDDITNIVEYLDKDIATFYKEYKNDRNLIIQAHPFRDKNVIAPLEWIDGIEAFNVHPNHNSRVSLAASYAKEHNLIMIGGSDFHEPERAALCVMRSKKLPNNSYDIVEILKSRDFILEISGSLLLPYN